MATVHFYEKPGCFNNTRQKQLLLQAGHLLVVYNLPVADWFNRSAPAIKSGDVVPELLSERDAIEVMVADPLLIRRPLLEVEGRRRVGFDAESIDAWLGLSAGGVGDDLETCPRQHKQQACQS